MTAGRPRDSWENAHAVVFKNFQATGFMVGGDNDEGILPSLCPVKCNLHRSRKFKRLVNIALNVVRVSSVIDSAPLNH